MTLDDFPVSATSAFRCWCDIPRLTRTGGKCHGDGGQRAYQLCRFVDCPGRRRTQVRVGSGLLALLDVSRCVCARTGLSHALNGLLFVGTAIYWNSAHNPNGGIGRVSVDGEDPVDVDESVGTEVGEASVEATLWGKTGLDGSVNHTFELAYVGAGQLGGGYLEIYSLAFVSTARLRRSKADGFWCAGILRMTLREAASRALRAALRQALQRALRQAPRAMALCRALRVALPAMALHRAHPAAVHQVSRSSVRLITRVPHP